MTTRIWEAQARTDEGKGASRRLRHAGLVPAIIYGADKAPASVTLNHNFLVHAFEDDAVFNSPITVKGLADEEVVVIKAVQRHPAKPQILHADFHLQRALAQSRRIVHRTRSVHQYMTQFEHTMQQRMSKAQQKISVS